MNKQEIFEKLQDIFRIVFDDPKLKIEPSTNSSTIKNWDSLNHINLIVAIQKEFRIKFDLKELQALNNVGEMMHIVEKKNIISSSI
jgi:acyl carrier protein